MRIAVARRQPSAFRGRDRFLDPRRRAALGQLPRTPPYRRIRWAAASPRACASRTARGEVRRRAPVLPAVEPRFAPKRSSASPTAQLSFRVHPITRLGGSTTTPGRLGDDSFRVRGSLSAAIAWATSLSPRPRGPAIVSPLTHSPPLYPPGDSLRVEAFVTSAASQAAKAGRQRLDCLPLAGKHRCERIRRRWSESQATTPLTADAQSEPACRAPARKRAARYRRWRRATCLART